jgi:hypothetical protein
MQKHRGLLMSLVVGALLGFGNNQAEAGSLTFDFYYNGTLIDTVTNPTGGVVSGQTLGGVNTALHNAHSAYSLTQLTATFNTVGDNVTLATAANLKIVAGTNLTTGTFKIVAVESDILTPTGMTGTLNSAFSGTYTSIKVGTSSFYGDYLSTATPTLSGNAATSPAFSDTSPDQSVSMVVPGYSLSNTTTFAGLSKVTGATVGATGTVSLTAVPEPSSVVMLLTGMPLPLGIVFGLIRRRRARA